ncbi:hypothetical protein [Streptomyces sp. NBC_00467]|uniref:hypothetical protein n=1 Tax=Streptomyces sp. NBC_00467 TaxID=2975752 RepID=UPI002E172D75
MSRQPHIVPAASYERLSAGTTLKLTRWPVISGISLGLVILSVTVHALGPGHSWLLLAGNLMTATILMVVALLGISRRKVELDIHGRLDGFAAALGQSKGAQRDIGP